MDQLQISVPCKLQFRDPVAALLANICQQLQHGGRNQGLAHQVVSAFNEAFNNVTQYSPQAGQQRVEIQLALEPEQLTIEIQDGGEGFALETVQPPDLDQLPESGLGLFIIRSFMTDVSYERDEARGRNTLRMRRQVEPVAATDNTVRGTTDDA